MAPEQVLEEEGGASVGGATPGPGADCSSQLEHKENMQDGSGMVQDHRNDHADPVGGVQTHPRAPCLQWSDTMRGTQHQLIKLTVQLNIAPQSREPPAGPSPRESRHLHHAGLGEGARAE